MMTNEQANELFRLYRKTHDIKIRNQLVENYIYVAEILAKKFVGKGVDYEDLLQTASEALIQGIERFDPDMGNQFTTFITPTITGMIKNYFRDSSRMVKYPRRLYTLNVKIKEATNEFFKKNGVKPTVKQLAELLDSTEEDVQEALECHSPISLDETVKGTSGSSDGTVADFIADGNNVYDKFEESESLKEALSRLSESERQIIILRFVKKMSQAEVGKILGVSQMFISRAERKILEKLRGLLTDD